MQERSTVQRVDRGFNRYMVECELLCSNVRKCVAPRFNRYMVECE